jgi:3-oxoacyl-[acyl-carrier protein] reductase
MELELNGKVALVTGSSRGIGRAIAETLYAEGCKVIINGRSREDLASAAETLPGAVIAQGE